MEDAAKNNDILLFTFNLSIQIGQLDSSKV